MLGTLPPVYVHPGQIEQVIATLVDNAAKHTPGSTIHSTGAVADGGASIDLVVEDDAPGISQDDPEQIFDRFYRGRTVERSDTPGSGLGLPIARMIVGAMAAESARRTALVAARGLS
jgi:two-component system phosphate regulon sensor histidine kinase PhoR